MYQIDSLRFTMHPDIGILNSGKCYVFLDGYGLEIVEQVPL